MLPGYGVGRNTRPVTHLLRNCAVRSADQGLLAVRSKDEDLTLRRRRQIIDATIEAIYRRGIADLRLADVARAAGVSYGVVSFYFKSKDALLLATMNDVAAEYAMALHQAAEAPAATPMARLLSVLDVNFDARIAEPRKTAVWVAIWGQSQVSPAFRKRCCELQDDYVSLTEPICRAIVKSGDYAAVDPREIARVLCVMMSGFDVEMHLRGRGYSVPAAKRTCHALLAGIFPREFAAATSRRKASRKVPAARRATATRAAAARSRAAH
jgi:TetR/AcrR family transcriptional repressor of bet genes